MPVRWTAQELIDMAVRIEKNGAAFYDSLAASANEKELKATYSFLAGEERRHATHFGKLSTDVMKEQLKAMYDARTIGEAEQYLEAIADSRVFADDTDALKWAQRGKTKDEVLLAAIILEKDSILFYQEMRNFVSEKDRKVVDEIIREEKSHVLTLSKLKSK